MTEFLREILDTISRNKSRSLLTGFGIFWGIFMLVSLIGGTHGLKELLNSNFSNFATNSAMVWAKPTTKVYKGFQKGRTWQMTMDDIKRVKNNITELDVVTPVLFGGNKLSVFGEHSFSANVNGVTHDYQKVCTPEMRYGRHINAMDIIQDRKVCVIGKQVYDNLFPDGGDPLGKSIRIDSTYYRVVGVDVNPGNFSIGGRTDESILVPISVMQRVYNYGNEVHLIALTAKEGIKIGLLTDHIRQMIARHHLISPEDEQAISVFNTEVLFGILDSLFKGVTFLSWLVGIGTLLAGAIGVSNIMMVTVKERTVEIGIRRAIGATPRMILTQIISESIVLTAVAGMIGVLFAVSVLQMIELANTTDGVVAARFQVDFWTAIIATLLLCLLGAMAGMAPALRAMAIKPVDAMRDE
ncbi:MAG: ABC transporter permease [Bacteroidaceae bacterium]|nr:ABC transporter permease [Bacteroidaceae bacterium]